MRDPNRIPEILETLRQVWSKNPDLRLGQIIVIATRPTEVCREVFYIEDSDLVKGLASILSQETPKGGSPA